MKKLLCTLDRQTGILYQAPLNQPTLVYHFRVRIGGRKLGCMPVMDWPVPQWFDSTLPLSFGLFSLN